MSFLRNRGREPEIVLPDPPSASGEEDLQAQRWLPALPIRRPAGIELQPLNPSQIKELHRAIDRDNGAKILQFFANNLQADPNAYGKERTLLQRAVGKERPEALRALIAAGADVNKKSRSGRLTESFLGSGQDPRFTQRQADIWGVIGPFVHAGAGAPLRMPPIEG